MNTKSKKSSKSNARNKAARKVVKHVKRGVKVQRPVAWAAERKVAKGIEVTLRRCANSAEPKKAVSLAVQITHHNEVKYIVYVGKKVNELCWFYKDAIKAYKATCK